MSQTFNSCKLLNPWLEEMLESGLDPLDVNKLIMLFLQAAPTIIKEAEEKLKSGDLQSAARAAHRLVGGSANVGVHKLETIARELESVCETGQRDYAIVTMAALSEQYILAENELEHASARLRGVC